MPSRQKSYTIRDFDKQFPDDEACFEWLRDFLYPDGIVCSICKEIRKHHRMRNRMSYSCDRCGHHEHPMAGTIFEDTRTPLKSWFYAIYLMAQTRCGISAKHLQRELGVTYKTAWRMFKEIRRLLEEGPAEMAGTVEIDETYVGGKRRYRNGEQPPRNSDGSLKRGRRTKADDNKTAVVGMVQRGGKIRAYVADDIRAATVLPMVEAHVLPSTTVYTDEALTYNSLRKRGYAHRRVHHSAKVYVDGDVHTNTIEGFWSLLKRSIGGAHHAVSAKYLQSYINEYTFRYNHRDDAEPMFASFLAQIAVTPAD